MADQILTLKKAARRQAFLKLGMAAPSGGGKTLGALLIAYGLMKEKYPKASDEELWGKIAIIDSENGSGELYVGSVFHNIQIGEYGAITLNPPFTAQKYISAIDVCEKNGIEVCIIDSTTHLWAGEGGLLDKQNTIAASSKSGNSYVAWRQVTPDHNHFVDKMLQSKMHVIATMRSKVEYVQEKNSEGVTSVRKVGLKPVQREGMEYEFTVFLDISDTHVGIASKDRTGLLDGRSFTISPDVGTQLMEWLETSTDSAPVVVADNRNLSDLKKSITHLIKKNEDKKDDYEKVFESHGIHGTMKDLDLEQAKKLLTDMEAV